MVLVVKPNNQTKRSSVDDDDPEDPTIAMDDSSAVEFGAISDESWRHCSVVISFAWFAQIHLHHLSHLLLLPVLRIQCLFMTSNCFSDVFVTYPRSKSPAWFWVRATDVHHAIWSMLISILFFQIQSVPSNKNIEYSYPRAQILDFMLILILIS